MWQDVAGVCLHGPWGSWGISCRAIHVMWIGLKVITAGAAGTVIAKPHVIVLLGGVPCTRSMSRLTDCGAFDGGSHANPRFPSQAKHVEKR